MYRYIDNMATADMAIYVTGDSLEELFIEAARGVCNLMANIKRLEPEARVEVDVESEDTESLLFDFLNDVIYMFDTEKLLVLGGEIEISPSKEGYRLSGSLYVASAEGAELYTEVKAVTYYKLGISQRDDGKWETTIVVDL